MQARRKANFVLALLWVLQVSRLKDTKRVLVGFPPQVSRFKDT